jgi:cytochrome c oxidase subunit 4
MDQLPVDQSQKEFSPTIHTSTGPFGTDHAGPKLFVYFLVYGALLLLLLATVAVTELRLGQLGVLLALVIAIVKALLVMVYFMHLRYSSRLTWLFAGAGFVWLLIMFVFVMADYVSRGWVGQ